MRVYRISDRDLTHMLDLSLVDDYKKQFFIEMASLTSNGLARFIHTVFISYAVNYRNLHDVTLTTTEHNRIYDNFTPVAKFLAERDKLYNAEGGDIYYVNPAETIVDTIPHITNGFSPYMYDDFYVLADEMFNNEDCTDILDYANEVNIQEKMESVVEIVKYLVREIETRVLPYGAVDQGTPLMFAVVGDQLLTFIDY